MKAANGNKELIEQLQNDIDGLNENDGDIEALERLKKEEKQADKKKS